MRVLVSEQRRKPQVLVAPVRAPGLVVGRAPGGPRRCVDRVHRRAQRQQVDDHRFVVAAPVEPDESVCRHPAQRDQRRARLCPGPVHAGVNGVDQLPDPRFVVVGLIEPALAEQHSGQQQRGVHRRQLAVPEPQAAVHVEEVIEETLVSGDAREIRTLRRLGEKTQRRQHPIARLRPRDPAALDSDRIGGQREADRRDAGRRRRRVAIRHQAIGGIGGLPEKIERAPMHIVKQRLDGCDRRRRRRRGPGRRAGATAGERTGQGKQPAAPGMDAAGVGDAGGVRQGRAVRPSAQKS